MAMSYCRRCIGDTCMPKLQSSILRFAQRWNVCGMCSFFGQATGVDVVCLAVPCFAQNPPLSLLSCEEL